MYLVHCYKINDKKSKATSCGGTVMWWLLGAGEPRPYVPNIINYSKGIITLQLERTFVMNDTERWLGMQEYLANLKN